MEKIFLPFAELPILNIALGICMVRTIRNLGVEGCFLKWPNDVYIQGKKVCGILSELISHDQKQFIISGIGVNYQGRPDEFPAELHGKAAILQAHAQNIPERTLFISNYFAEVEAYFDRVRQQGLAVIQKDFTELWIYKNHPISINDGHSTYEGVSDTIDAYGALLVQTKEDSFKRIFSADISPIKTKNVD